MLEQGGSPTITVDEVKRGFKVLVGVLLASPVVGVVWWMVAPLPRMQMFGRSVVLVDPEGEAAVAADGWFAVCAGSAGLVCAVVAFAMIRRARVGALLGLTVGGLIAAVVAWRVGVLLGPAPVHEQAKGLAAGASFDGPLALSAKAVLFAWPLISVIVYFALTAGLEPPTPWTRGRTGEAGAEPSPGAADVQRRDGARFPTTVLRPGYVIADVDRFFAQLEQGLLSDAEVRSARFGSTRLTRGYDEAEVDAAIAGWLSSRAPQP